MKISDNELYILCKKYGTAALIWRRKFTALLPEVYKRKLYEKKGFGSIFEFAAKLAGISEEQVRLALNIERRIEDKPLLKELFNNGTVSINKLARVISVVNKENEHLWAQQIQNLSKNAVEVLVRDVKTFSPSKNLPGHVNVSLNDEMSNAVPGNLNLLPEVLQKLLELQSRGIDINSLLLEFLRKREVEINRQKNVLAQEQNNQSTSRYIPVKIQNILKQEFGTKCSVPICNKQAEEIHHTNRFALSRNHNPYFLAPLCKEHHQIAHAIDTKVMIHRRGAVVYSTAPP